MVFLPIITKNCENLNEISIVENFDNRNLVIVSLNNYNYDVEFNKYIFCHFSYCLFYLFYQIFLVHSLKFQC